ncbi:hypothetical protein JHK82_027329 [Glycine max]|nr:hypothetical protein JHK82_027329 [Glycine max]
MDSAIRSRTPPNLGTSPIHSFASIVDNTIRSGASSNFGSSPVHGFASVVDNVIRSGTASNFGTSPIHGFASMEEMRMSLLPRSFLVGVLQWSSSQKSSSRRHKLWLSILVPSLRLLHWVSVSVSSTIEGRRHCGCWVLEVEDEVLPREEASSARVLGDEDGVSGKRCSSASSYGRKVKGSSAGASGRRSRRFFCLIQRKNLLDLLLLEPAEKPF